MACPKNGITTIGASFLDDDFDVACTCGFTVEHLTSQEAADDTARWHQGDSATPLGAADTGGPEVER